MSSVSATAALPLPGFGRGAMRALLASMLAAALLLLVGCGERLPTYRYRMTVEVDTPEGLRTGSSVIEVRTRIGSGFPGPEAGGIRSAMRGEAVAVDLGERGLLFALLSSPEEPDYAMGVAPGVLLPPLPELGGSPQAWGEKLRILKGVSGAADVPREQYPLLVRFRDPSQPTTVTRVEPGDLAAHFGTGVRLRRITVEITDESVTRNIAEKLPWLSAWRDRQLDGDRYVSSANLANLLNERAFIREN